MVKEGYTKGYQVQNIKNRVTKLEFIYLKAIFRRSSERDNKRAIFFSCIRSLVGGIKFLVNLSDSIEFIGVGKYIDG